MNYPDTKVEVYIILNSPLAPLFEREGKRYSAFIINSIYRGVSYFHNDMYYNYPDARVKELFRVKKTMYIKVKLKEKQWQFPITANPI